jgi:hypothetical protein
MMSRDIVRFVHDPNVVVFAIAFLIIPLCQTGVVTAVGEVMQSFEALPVQQPSHGITGRRLGRQ